MKLSNEAINIIKRGSPIAGAVTGSVLRYFSGSPESTFAAAGIGAHLPFLINDFADRFLSKREQEKIGAVEAFSIHRIMNNIELGKKANPKFINDSDLDNPIVDLYEGILIKAKNEFELRKLELIGNIYANSLFDENLNPHDSNHFLNLTDNLSYRKLCVLSYYSRKNDFPGVILLPNPFLWYEDANFSISTISISQDLFELREQGLLNMGAQNNFMAGDRSHITPKDLLLSPIGQLYSKTTDLKNVDDEDVLPIMKEVEYRDEYGKSKH